MTFELLCHMTHNRGLGFKTTRLGKGKKKHFNIVYFYVT